MIHLSKMIASARLQGRLAGKRTASGISSDHCDCAGAFEVLAFALALLSAAKLWDEETSEDTDCRRRSRIFSSAGRRHICGRPAELEAFGGGKEVEREPAEAPGGMPSKWPTRGSKSTSGGAHESC